MKTIFTLLVSFFTGLAVAQAQWVTQPVPPITGEIRKIHIVDPNIVWAEVNSNLTTPGTPDNFLLRTTNSGLTWSAVMVSLPGVTGPFSVTSLEPVDHNKAFVTVSLGNPIATRVYKTTDGGQTWTLIPGIFTGQHSYANFVHFFDYQNGMIMGDNQEIYTTHDGGATWTRVPQANLPAPATLEYTVDRRIGFGDTIWVPANDMRLYRSTDNGLHWTVSNTNIPATTPGHGPVVVGLAFQDARNGLASHGANLSRTTNGGITWAPVAYTGPFYPHGLLHLPGTPNSYLSYGPLNTNPGMSLTTDGGLTWANIDNTAHFTASFVNNMSGWSGGNGIMRKFSGVLLGASKEISSESSYFIFPNPAKSHFHVSPSTTEPFDLEVYDMAGKLITRQQGNRFGKNTLDLSGREKGLYLLHILNGERRIVEKIILQ